MNQTRADSPPFPHWASAGYALTMLTAGLLVAALEPGLVRTAPLSLAELTEILAPLLVVSLFIERAIEVFITTWRQAARDQLELACQESELSSSEHERRRRRVTAHRADTRRAALLASATVGVLVSALGLRALEPLMDADMLSALEHWQRVSFSVVDVTLSGALLAGGAEGLHQIVSAFTTFMEQSALRMRSPTA